MTPIQLKKYQKYAMTRLVKEFKEACKAGDLNLVKFFLFSKDLPANVNPLVDNSAGLRWACAAGQIKIVKFFMETPGIKANISVNSNEPFRKSCEHGHLDVAKYLSKYKINLREWSDYALRKSCLNMHFDVMEFLLFDKKLKENCDINSITIINDVLLNSEPDGTVIEKNLKDSKKIFNFIFMHKKLKGQYNITNDDWKHLTDGDNFKDELIYLIIDCHQEIKDKFKKNLDSEIWDILEKIEFKESMTSKLGIKGKAKSINRIKI